MLIQFDTAHYRTFGYTTVHGLLDHDEAAALADEITAAHREGFGSRHGTLDGGGGIEGHYMPTMADRTPISAGLVDDPRLFDACRVLASAGWWCRCPPRELHCCDAGWHFDAGIGVTVSRWRSTWNRSSPPPAPRVCCRSPTAEWWVSCWSATGPTSVCP
jgi:hypothetical protein